MEAGSVAERRLSFQPSTWVIDTNCQRPDQTIISNDDHHFMTRKVLELISRYTYSVTFGALQRLAHRLEGASNSVKVHRYVR